MSTATLCKMPSARIDLVDNAKAVLIVLVVLGHLLETTLDGSQLHRILYLAIHSFHMPSFVFISGMLAESTISNESMRKWIASLVLPLFIFQMLYEIPGVVLTGHLSQYTSQLQPYWLLWYLWSVMLWRLGLPALLVFRYPIPIAIGIAVLAGYVPETGYYLGISRTLTFFPFFVAGNRFGRQLCRVVTTLPSRVYFTTSLVAVLLLVGLLSDIDHRWLWGSLSYSSLGDDSWTGGMYRLLLLSVSAIAGVLFLAAVPRYKTSLSKLGKNSLFVYLWHGFFVRTLTTFNATVTDGPEILTILLYGLETAAITAFLASDVVALHTRKLLLSASSVVLERVLDHRTTQRQLPEIQRP